MVYVESNFVLELALLQEQHRSCGALLALATAGQVRLVVPAFSLAEPHETLIRAKKKRQFLADELRRELRQLGRSEPYGERTAALAGLPSFLIDSFEDERDRLRVTLRHVLDAAELIPLTAEILRTALRIEVEQHFSPQDAVVYASILDHLTRTEPGPKVFLNRNSKDFDDPIVQDELERWDCKIVFGFNQGLNYVRHHLGSGAEA